VCVCVCVDFTEKCVTGLGVGRIRACVPRYIAGDGKKR
jgi:hypothetical protein